MNLGLYVCIEETVYLKYYVCVCMYVCSMNLLLLDQHVDEDELVQGAHVVEVVLLQERTRVQAVVRAESRRVDRIAQYAVHLDECEYAQMYVCMYVCILQVQIEQFIS